MAERIVKPIRGKIVAPLRMERATDDGSRYGGKPWIRYTACGTAEQFIEHGLCEPEWIPRGRKRTGAGDFIKPAVDGFAGRWSFQKRGQAWNLHAYDPPEPFATAYQRSFEVYGPPKEPEADLFAPLLDPKETEYGARLFMQIAFKHGPLDVKTARDEKQREVERCVSLLKTLVFKNGAGPYNFRPDEDEAEELNEAFETIRRLVREIDIVRDQKLYDRIVQYRRARAARDDERLQQFLVKVQG